MRILDVWTDLAIMITLVYMKIYVRYLLTETG